MKQTLLFLVLLVLSATLWAQAPKKFNYQGIARNNTGTPMANQALGIRLSIVNDSATGELRYRETHTVTTNAYGLYNLPVGGGTADSNTMDSVVWAIGEKWMLVEIDPAGGTNYVSMGATQLLSVPYALYSENPGNQGPPGTPGTPGAPGAPGVLSVSTFTGPAGSIAGSTGGGFAFVGPTTSVTVTSTHPRITGCGNAALGLSAGGPITVNTSLCYQLGAGTITNLSNVYLLTAIGTQRNNVSAMASGTLAPGTYTVGFCVHNSTGVPIANTDFVSGWVIVTP